MTESRITIRVQEDEMCAWAHIEAGTPTSQTELEACMAATGVTDGIDSLFVANLGLALAQPDFEADEIPIAIGDPGEDGEDGFFTLRFTGLKQVGSHRPNGSIDFKERFKIYHAEPEDELARYTPPTKGRTGKTVLGAKVPHENGEKARLPCGPGAQFDEELNIVEATRAGMISYVADKSISVLDLFSHEGDVDYASGNLRVEGSVAIGGTLLPDFEISASGDVFVQGGNAAGNIRADGNIAVAGGILSSSNSTVEAKGDVTCHHANNVEIVSGRSALIEDHAVDVRIYAQEIRIDTGRGRMIGGAAHAHTSIRVAEAGSPGGTPTHLHVANLDRERRERKARKTKVEGERDLGWIELDLLKQAKVTITKAVHPGVTVHFAEHRYEVIDYAENVTFRWDSEEQRIVMEGQSLPLPSG